MSSSTAKFTPETVPSFGSDRLGYGDRLLPFNDPDDPNEVGKRVATLYVDGVAVHETYYSDHASSPSNRWLYDQFLFELREVL